MPKRMFGASGSGQGIFKPNPTGAGYNSRYRTLPVGQILAQRRNASSAHYQDGTPVPRGTKLFVPGYNTSGVGPGTRGYSGSWRPGGYNFGEGTRRPSARTSGEFYAQRDAEQGNPLDNLQLGNSNLMGSFLKNAMAEARGGANTAPMTRGGSDVWQQTQSRGTVTGIDGAPAMGASAEASDPEMALQNLISEARAQEALDNKERAMLELEAMQPRTGEGTTTSGATIDGLPSDLWFQYKANESGETNQFATPPYGGPMTEEGSPEAWQYQTRLAPFLRRLGLGQNPAFRRPL